MRVTEDIVCSLSAVMKSAPISRYSVVDVSSLYLFSFQSTARKFLPHSVMLAKYLEVQLSKYLLPLRFNSINIYGIEPFNMPITGDTELRQTLPLRRS